LPRGCFQTAAFLNSSLISLGGQGVQGRIRVPGVEFCDDHHALAPVFFKTPSSRRLHVLQMPLMT
jgi:hypothetical protein